MNRAIGIRLQYADANMRRLVVAALREKAARDRKAAGPARREGHEPPKGHAHVSQALRAQAELAEQIAEELESV